MNALNNHIHHDITLYIKTLINNGQSERYTSYRRCKPNTPRESKSQTVKQHYCCYSGTKNAARVTNDAKFRKRARSVLNLIRASRAVPNSLKYETIKWLCEVRERDSYFTSDNRLMYQPPVDAGGCCCCSEVDASRDGSRHASLCVRHAYWLLALYRSFVDEDVARAKGWPRCKDCIFVC